MITAVIPTLNSARDLHGLLSTLVPAAADGLLRQVLVLDAGSTDATLEICEDAGADVLGGSIAQAVRVARGDWVLVLPVDLRLRRGWDAAVTAHLERGGGAALLIDATEAERGIGRWFKRPKAGVLMRRNDAARAGEGADVEALVRRFGRGAPRLS